MNNKSQSIIKYNDKNVIQKVDELQVPEYNFTGEDRNQQCWQFITI